MYPGAHVSQFPGKPAVVLAGTDRALTYRELDDRSLRLARLLYDAGLRRGDHIAMLTGNDPAAFEIYWAALRSGLYITAVNRHLAPPEVAYIVDDCQARALIVSADLGEVAAQVAPDTPRVELRLAFGGPVDGHGSYEDALAGASREPLPSQPRGADMLYSSGTTGGPRASAGRCRTSRWTTRTGSPSSSARCTASTPTPCTSPPPRSTMPRRCGSAAWCRRSAAPSC